jgi:hypothetical protein
MHVIILAAGQSKRFQAEGHIVPKPFIEIEWQGTILPMIEHVINTVPIGFVNVISAVPPGYKTTKGWFPIEKTKGPADTASQMLDRIEPSSCLIIDSDILNFTNDLDRLTWVDGCGVLVSRSANPAFSYVNDLERFIHIKEKQRISEYAVRGAYYVSEEVMSEFTTVLRDVISGYEEPYISHAFDLMGCEKFAIETTYTPIDWGTPHDVKISGARIMGKTS